MQSYQNVSLCNSGSSDHHQANDPLSY